MKKGSGRLIGKVVNLFNYIGSVIVKLFKVLVQSLFIFYPPVLFLAIINAILGVNVRFSYYLIAATILTLVSFGVLSIINWKKILAKPIKKSKKRVPAKTDRKTQRAIHRKRKRIS